MPFVFTFILFVLLLHIMKNKRKQDSNNEGSKKKRVVLSLDKKKELCLLHQRNPFLIYKELGQNLMVLQKILCVIF